MSKEKRAMSIEEDAVEETVVVAKPPERLRQGNQPVCPIHKVQMVAYASSRISTYYKCPEKGCKERDQRMRPLGPLKNLYGNGDSAGKND